MVDRVTQNDSHPRVGSLTLLLCQTDHHNYYISFALPEHLIGKHGGRDRIPDLSVFGR